MGYPSNRPSDWYPPGNRPPVHATLFGPNGEGPGRDISVKFGQDGTSKQGHTLISDNYQNAYEQNNKPFGARHNHYGPNFEPVDRGAYRGPGW